MKIMKILVIIVMSFQVIKKNHKEHREKGNQKNINMRILVPVILIKNPIKKIMENILILLPKYDLYSNFINFWNNIKNYSSY